MGEHIKTFFVRVCGMAWHGMAEHEMVSEFVQRDICLFACWGHKCKEWMTFKQFTFSFIFICVQRFFFSPSIFSRFAHLSRPRTYTHTHTQLHSHSHSIYYYCWIDLIIVIFENNCAMKRLARNLE